MIPISSAVARAFRDESDKGEKMNTMNSKFYATGILALALAIPSCAEKKTFAGGNPTVSDEKKTPVVDDTQKAADVKPDTIAAPDTGNVFKDCTASATSPFIADLYQLPKNTQKLPDFSKLTSIKKICLNQIDITQREFTVGFPGVENLFEWFALNFKFNLKVETAGIYSFKVNSDDGSLMYIDGALVVPNDGQHSSTAVEKTVNLTAGSHKVNLQYYQGPANEIALELFWTPPGGVQAPVPPALVSRP